MKRKNRTVRRNRHGWSLDPVIGEALKNLKELSLAGNDLPKVMHEVTELLQKGVPGKVLADHCRVSIATISRWKARVTSSGNSLTSQKHRINPGVDQVPQIQVLDVVRAEPKRGFLPRINLRAEWVRIRLNFELF
jgi:hypothetical protein